MSLEFADFPLGCSVKVLIGLGGINEIGDKVYEYDFDDFVYELNTLLDSNKESAEGWDEPENLIENHAWVVAYSASAQSAAREHLKKLGFRNTKSAKHNKMRETRDMNFMLHFIEAPKFVENVRNARK